MRISIFPENGQWLLVLNRTEPQHDPAELDIHVASSFDRCWTGDDWGTLPVEGQRFESKAGALTYLNKHWQQMEDRAAVPSDPIPSGELMGAP